MKWLKNYILLTFILNIVTVEGTELNLKEEIQAMAEQVEIIKNLHVLDITRLRREIEEFKRNFSKSTQNQNEFILSQWTRESINDLRKEIKEINKTVNNSNLLQELHSIQNELKQALMETSTLTKLARTQETRIDKLDTEINRLKYEEQQMRSTLAQLRTRFSRLPKEMRMKETSEFIDSHNDVLKPHKIRKGDLNPQRSRKYRHNKMMHARIARLSRAQDQLNEYQQNLQQQLLDIQKRIDSYEEPNWNLLSAKVDFLELDTKIINDNIRNISQTVSDFDKVHASMLELREDVESIENKADATIPEFRKEISRLDVSYAQLNAQSSYLKEDQENLRQSVKAIAVSVSNAIDRAEIDRLVMKKINDSVVELNNRSKQHFYRLNDHILKSEANSYDTNETETIPLPELMGEVKELQPVQREYDDLVNQLPKDCSSISGPAGVYLIHPGYAPLETWCINGSTILQRRYNGSIEFNRKFSEYVQGFGNPASEYWLGLEAMHQLTADNCSSMRIDMTDIYEGGWYAQYEYFSVGSADTGYKLEVGGFSGNASDAFEYQNHMEFSAIDRDRDISNTHCAGNYEGGWWFSHCQHVNINGKYTLGLTWFDSAKNEWIAVATSVMRTYRRPDCF